MYFDVRFGLPFAVIGIKSWRCCRETEIWRAMDTSAALLKRSSRSSCSVLLSMSIDFFGAEEADRDGDVRDASESFHRGKGWVTIEAVVALRERSLGGGACILTVLRLEVVNGAIDVVDMLDADVEVEWSELELVEPEMEDAGT